MMHGDLLTRAFVFGWFLLLLLGWNAAMASTTKNDSNVSDDKRRFRLVPANNNDASDHCITSADCAFNGECVKASISGHHNGTNNTSSNIAGDPEAPGFCDCFDGWKGNTCEVLDLLPVDPQQVGLVLPNHDSSTWGGSVVYYEKDNLYHMFASEILYNCGLYSWTTNSQVIRAVSESPFGPYKKVQVILPPFAHDANIIRAPTGEFVLYVTALKGVIPSDCRNQTTNAMKNRKERFLRKSQESSNDDDDDVPPKDTYMLWAPTPEGPWSEPIMVLNSTIYNTDYWKKYNKTAKCDSNLNGIILPANDETGKQPFWGLWRRCETENLLTIPHALIASDWKNASSYQPIIDHPLFVLAGSGAEDPSNIWTTKTDNGVIAYHAIFHDEQATRCMLGSCGGQGRHAVSLDGLTWRYASVNAYERHFAMGKSNSKKRADTRARPHVVLAPNNNGEDQRPIALSTGLKETDESGYVYTLVQPLGQRFSEDSRKTAPGEFGKDEK